MVYTPKFCLQGEHTSSLTCITFSPTRLYITSGDLSGCLIVWSVEDGGVLWRCQGHTTVLTVFWSSLAKQDCIFCGYGDGSLVAILIVGDGLRILGYRVLSSPVECLALQEKSHYLASSGLNKIIMCNATHPTNSFCCAISLVMLSLSSIFHTWSLFTSSNILDPHNDL